MALVEGVAGELRPVGPDLLQRVLLVALLRATSEELYLELCHLVGELLTHCLTQAIGFASREVCDFTREKHHLLLIDGDPIGILEVALHTGQVVGDGLTAVLTIDEVGDVVHRPWTIKGVHRYEVLEGGRLEFAQILLHPSGFKLERAHGLPLGV